MTDLDKIIDRVKEVSGLDIFRNTRQTEYVEARTLLMGIMRNELFYTVERIAEELTKRGYKYTHSSVVISLQKLDMYLATSPIMRSWSYRLDFEKEEDVEAKIRFIKNKVPLLQSKDIEQLNNLVRDMYEEVIIRESEVEFEMVN